MKEYVKDLQIQMSSAIETINGNEYGGGKSTSMLIGLTSLSCDKKLLPENGCEIKWYEGYDESIFSGDKPVCLIPERMAKTRYYDNGNGEADLYFNYTMTTIKDGVMIVNDQRMDPMTVAVGLAEYPENIIETLKEKHDVVVVDAQGMALEIGNSRVFNTIIIGVAAKRMDFEKEAWLKVIEETVPAKTVEINKKAFEAGYAL